MKNIYQTLTLIAVLLLGWINPASGNVAPEVIKMQEGYTYLLDGFEMTVEHLESAYSGSGSVYFEALDMDLAVSFKGLMITEMGQQLSGRVSTVRGERLAEITEAMTQIQGISMPHDSKMFLTGFNKDMLGTVIDLDLDAGTVVDREYLSFSKEDITVKSNDICLEGVDMTMVKDGKINDFQFPLRIIAGNPDDEKVGSYITFNCKGFKNFNLSAIYDFPKNQLESYTVKTEGANTATTSKSATSKQDTVHAYFTINAPSLKSFIVTGSIDAFQVPGVDDMGFSAKEVVIDYSDTTNYDGFKYVDKSTKKEVDNKWKGIYIKSTQMYLPKSISSFNDGGAMTLGVKDLVYDRGNGISFVAEATNLLKIADGNANGWGVSIDTIDIKVEYNSFEKMRLIGDIYIPITAKDENIGYEASFGKKDSVTSMNFALSIAGTYTLPFLKGSKLTMLKSSKAGMNYVGGSYEPFADLSGSIDITVKAGDLPELNIPKLGFENLTLGDIISSIKSGAQKAKDAAKSAAGTAKKEVTGGLDKLAIKAFTFGGKRFNLAQEAPAKSKEETDKSSTEEEEGEQKKISGFPISIKSWKFKSDSTNSKIKILGADFRLNLCGKGGGGISGNAGVEVFAEMDYAKIISKTPWKAFGYKTMKFDAIKISAKVGVVSFEGAIKFINNDKIYGNGLKGGIKLAFDGGPKVLIEAVGQFGQIGDTRYFFVEAGLKSDVELFGMFGMAIYGVKGGLFYNMTQKNSINPTPISERATSPLPGYGMSLYKYVPDSGSFGLKAGITMGLQGSPRVICGDVLFGVEMKVKDYKPSVSKLTIEGAVSLMAESVTKMDEAPIIVEAALMIDLANGLMTANLKGALDFPKAKPIFKGRLLASLQVDINPLDNNKYKNYITIGRPTDRLELSFIATDDVRLDCDAYFMLGEFPEASSEFRTNSGVAFGFKGVLKPKTVSAGPIDGEYSGHLHTWGVFSDEITPSCNSYNRNDYGIAGMYLKTNLNFDLKMKADFKYDLWYRKGTVNIFDARAKGKVVAELPRPTNIKGNVDINGSFLGGLVKINTNLKFEIGDKCSSDNGSIDANQITKFDAACIKDISGQDKYYYFFVDDKCYIRKQGGSKFTVKSISDAFSGVPNNLDAACFRKGNYYFFKGTNYYKYKAGSGKSAAKKDIKTGWTDKAYYNLDFAIGTESGYYFFKGGKYFKYKDGKNYDGSYFSNNGKDKQAGVYNMGTKKLYFFDGNKFLRNDWGGGTLGPWSSPLLLAKYW